MPFPTYGVSIGAEWRSIEELDGLRGTMVLFWLVFIES